MLEKQAARVILDADAQVPIITLASAQDFYVEWNTVRLRCNLVLEVDRDLLV